MKLNFGKIVGAVLFAGATAAMLLWPKAEVRVEPDVSIRPVRSVVVQAGMRLPDIRLPGRIKAAADRTMCFKVQGRIQRIPVFAGQSVKKGDKLAWLDPLDYEKDLAKAVAAEKRDRLTYERKREAGARKAISQEEVSQAETQLRQSEAQLAIARRAVEDTVLLAPFDGTVAEVPAKELEVVQSTTPVVLVHDLSKVKVDVVVPENLAILQKRIRSADATNSICSAARVSFDSAPGRSYPVRFVEYVSNADRQTQTYVATYEMDAPPDLMLLPGMSATLFIGGESYRYESDESRDAVIVPESALGVADDASAFVWLLEATDAADVYAVRRQQVTLSHRSNGQVTVLTGLRPGVRIATAGVMQLTEGRRVRLLTK